METHLYVSSGYASSTADVLDRLWTHVVVSADYFMTSDTGSVGLDRLRDAKINHLQDSLDEYKVCRLQVRVDNT